MFRSRVLRKYARRSFVVTLDDGSMFQGALVDWDSETMEFAMVKVHDPESGKFFTAADGPVVVDRTNVKYMQRVSVHAAE